MKRLAPFFLCIALAAFFAQPVFAATSSAAAKPADKSPGVAVAGTLTTLTGIAISPLLGTGAYGAYRYVMAEEAQRPTLPWFAKPGFFVPALLIALVCAFKDSLGTVLPPGWKKPLDVLETLENKLSGLVAAGAVIPFTMDALSVYLSGGTHGSTGTVYIDGLAMLPIGAIDWSWVLNILTVPFAIVVFGFVWMTSHAINVLILLSPWGAIDAFLKGARTSVLGLLVVTSWMDPKISAALSILIIVISYFTAGWAYRLTVFGMLFCWDFFTFRSGRFELSKTGNKLFSGAKLKGLPIRTYGRLVSEPENGQIVLVYRPWIIRPERRVVVPMTAPFISRGLFFSAVCDGDGTTLILPPRYRGHEEAFATMYRLEGGVKDAGLLKAWGVMRELFGGSAASAQVV